MSGKIILEGGIARGVEILSRRGVERVNCAKEIILSAGAFQSPQLLMLSGIGDEKELASFGIVPKQHLPGTGKNLQDHVWSGVSGLANIPTGNSLIRPVNMARALVQHLVFKNGPLSNSPLEANAFLKSRHELLRPDIQLHFAPIGISGDYSTDIYDLNTFSRKDGYGILVILVRPESRGYVSLQSADPLKAPLIQPNLLSAPADMELMVKALRKAIDIGQSDPMKKYSPGRHLFPRLAGF